MGPWSVKDKLFADLRNAEKYKSVSEQENIVVSTIVYCGPVLYNKFQICDLFQFVEIKFIRYVYFPIDVQTSYGCLKVS